MRCVDIPGRSPKSSLDLGGVCDCVCARGVGARSSLILLLSVYDSVMTAETYMWTRTHIQVLDLSGMTAVEGTKHMACHLDRV